MENLRKFLKTNRIVECRNGDIGVINLKAEKIFSRNSYADISDYNEELIEIDGPAPEFDIVAIYKPAANLTRLNSLLKKGDLLWERKDAPEYVELLKDVAGYGQQDIAKVIRVNEECNGCYILSVPNRISTSQHKPHISCLNTNFKPSTKAAYEAQQKQIKQDELLEEAKRRYPVGTRFYPAHIRSDKDTVCIITNNNFRFGDGGYVYAETDEGRVCSDDKKYGTTYYNRVIFDVADNKWAEIIKDIPEYTMEEAILKLGHEFKIKK